MACKEIKTRTYQTRKSPAFHAKDCKGLSKKGKDGIYTSKPDARGIYKWIKSSSHTTKKRKGTHYDIHDNGGRPYRVFIEGSKISIYKNTQMDWSAPPEYTKRIKELKVTDFFIGKSTGRAESADHTPKQAHTFIGNSILLHVSGKKYMHIGVEIYEFEMNDTVDAYFSMVGRNDVPYPVLLGTDNVYFMLDHVYVPRDVFPSIKTKSQWEDAYSYYYGYMNAETGKNVPSDDKKQASLKKYATKMKGFHMIQKHL